MKNIIVKVGKPFFTRDILSFLYESFQAMGHPVGQCHAVMKELGKYKARTIGKRVLRAIIMGSVDKQVAIRILTKDISEIQN